MDKGSSSMSKDGAGSKDRGVGNNWGVGNAGSGSIGGNSLVGHFGDVAAVGVSHVVVDVLDPAVGEVDRVGSIPEAGSIVGLGLLEGSARELVSHTVLVGVGGDLAEIVEPDSVGHRVGDGVHDRPGHGHRSSMHHRAGNSHGSSNSHTMAN